MPPTAPGMTIAGRKNVYFQYPHESFHLSEDYSSRVSAEHQLKYTNDRIARYLNECTPTNTVYNKHFGKPSAQATKAHTTTMKKTLDCLDAALKGKK
ncbi:hypothetical protein GLAREA_07386 [Glarea lozoyensis ATCC 20868]|uniref:Uncharacterized protein n=1 Tax=Glarea lozoyensis (strain ATCC 20868 / MF5171) TaxID=1116229 RepID=S3E177_GLAL2|nr:uncharacterized protein GLAREA_07386 [Glarea lozoyensis ATCC 20868]EPE32253.1 hypothetical protein GLAREA_07386 [Glarea lozoyensis ATCC 20868]